MVTGQMLTRIPPLEQVASTSHGSVAAMFLIGSLALASRYKAAGTEGEIRPEFRTGLLDGSGDKAPTKVFAS